MQEEILTEESPVETNLTDEIIQNLSEEGPQPEATEPEVEDLETLKSRRRGFFDVPSMILDDLKWLRNFLNSSVEFTGPNEAFVILQNHNMVLGEIENQKRIDRELKGQEVERIVRLQSACIESCLYFLNKAKFTGLQNAQSLFKVAFQLNNAYSTVHALDTKIKALEEAQKAAPAEETTEA
jgi:hypothetical protein